MLAAARQRIFKSFGKLRHAVKKMRDAVIGWSLATNSADAE
jgi:hypothetical protein